MRARSYTHHLASLADGYADEVQHLLKYGERVVVRGQETREIRDITLVFQDPTDCLPAGINRKYSKKIAAAETLQLIGGVSYPQLMLWTGSNFQRFLDGGTYHGAYGPRIRNQMIALEKLLRADPTTRQAIVNIWDPMHDLRDNVDLVKDVPCTTQFQFYIRDGYLEMSSRMRSNDIYWGTCYDITMFAQLLCTMANAFDLEPGPLNHHVGSFHLYDRDIDALERITQPSETAYLMRQKLDGLPTDSGFLGAMKYAREILATPQTEYPDETSRWLGESIAGWER